MCKKAVSYALYPKVYEDYCEHFEIYNDVTRLESHVYFYGLRKGEETYLKIGEGKELLIKYLEASEPDEDGYRTLMFQVNGSIRNVKILDKKLEIKTDRKLKASKSNPKQLGANIPGIVGNVLVKDGRFGQSQYTASYSGSYEDGDNRCIYDRRCCRQDLCKTR